MLSGELVGRGALSGEIQKQVIAVGGGDVPIKSISVDGVEVKPDNNKNVNIDLSGKADVGYVDQKVADLVNSAPETLDTLGEVASAIKENDDVVDALNSAIGNKADKGELADYVKNTDYASSTVAGVVRINANDGVGIGNTTKSLYISSATTTEISAKSSSRKPIAPSTIDYAVKVGMTTNTIELTEEEKAAAQSWLGIDTLVGDINTALTSILGV